MCRLPPLLPDSRHNLVVHCLMDYRLIGAAFLSLVVFAGFAQPAVEGRYRDVQSLGSFFG